MKLDLTKEYKAYYTVKSKPEVVEIADAQYLSIAGAGDPDGEGFAARLGALYAIKAHLAAQMMHTGPFSNEPATLQVFGTFMQQEGLAHDGVHHEIYLSDLRKTAPEKLRTILREPVKRVS